VNPTSRRAFLGTAGTMAAGVGVFGLTKVNDQDDILLAAAETGGATHPQVKALTPFKDALRIPPVIRPTKGAVTEITTMPRRIRLHSQMPLTSMWTYQGHYPGPTIEVRRGERTRIAWKHGLTGTSPVKGVWVPAEGPVPGFVPYNRPGAEGGRLRPEVAGLTAWTVTHLHGGNQFAVSDGGADGAVTLGGSQLAEYPNESAAAHLFYHDHAMPVTALNVMAGLMGQYIIRDPAESKLGLPSGKYEIPLAISDVNFDTTSGGLLTGDLLAKRVVHVPLTEINGIPESVAFMGPYTMVNGVVWPHLDVEARAYRFRMVNTSLFRGYRIVVVDEATGKPVRGAMKVIGTDLGLLGSPVVIDEALTLASAERVDFVIDFAAFPGKRLKLVNTIPGVPAGQPVPTVGLGFPDIMQFRVARVSAKPYTVPKKLDPGFKRLSVADVPKNAVERFVMLVLDGDMPQMWEMEEVPVTTPLGAGIVQLALPGGTRTLRRTATVFEDMATFYAAAGGWEKWTIFSAAPPPTVLAHPIHIHLMHFQVLERHAVDATGFDVAFGGTRTPITVGAAQSIDPEESGWKDTVRVGANSVVTIAGRYADQTGRFMYHCHMLDHEDEGMMRPLIIMPPAVLKVHHLMMAMHEAHESPEVTHHH
jgi:FtsP/CotA-like multicopper oxidase with cupredoxin domain